MNIIPTATNLLNIHGKPVANQIVLHYSDNRTAFSSYGSIIAVYDKETDTLFVNDKYENRGYTTDGYPLHSTTTTRHLNTWIRQFTPYYNYEEATTKAANVSFEPLYTK